MPVRRQIAIARLAYRLGRPLPAPDGWSPPPLVDLIARIDAALDQRRA